LAVDLRLDFLFEVLAIGWLHFPAALQWDTRLARNIDGKMSALRESEPPNEAEVKLLVPLIGVLAGVDAVDLSPAFCRPSASCATKSSVLP
jgi:hypothetical protein